VRAIGPLLLIACAVGSAAWADGKNVPHDGGHSPESLDPQRTPVRQVPTSDDQAPVAQLRFETRAGVIEAWADNNLAGPIEVLLRPVHGKVASADPPLPARAVVAALQKKLVARLGPETTAELRLEVVPGDPNARPRDIEYAYPLRTVPLQIEQGWGGTYSHHDAQNRYAVDFAADIGAQVIAARTGTVMEVESDFERAGLNVEQYAGRANFVRIVHDDGTMALYAHLKPDGVLVRVGQRVRKGEPIGLSGNTGFTTGPHLHFSVQVNRGMQLQSIPFRMFGPQGILVFAEPKPDQPAAPNPP
jgi:murein DD-endopeptidase MepM/ murein hydrolase activator NlpD